MTSDRHSYAAFAGPEVVGILVVGEPVAMRGCVLAHPL